MYNDYKAYPKFNPFRDYGSEPFVVNIEEATLRNNFFRTALLTGSYLQLTLMRINVGDDIGLEMHFPTLISLLNKVKALL